MGNQHAETPCQQQREIWQAGLDTAQRYGHLGGLEDELRSTKLKTFLDVVLPMFELIEFSIPEACLAGEIYRGLETRRQRIGVADTAIAATAIHKGLTVVTSNVGHFQRIIDMGLPLLIENWREP